MTAYLSLAAWGEIKITLGGSKPRACMFVQVAFQAMQLPVILVLSQPTWRDRRCIHGDGNQQHQASDRKEFP